MSSRHRTQCRCHARVVSIGVVFGASDGLLVMVDGLKSEPVSGSVLRRVIDVRQRKFAISPDVSAVVVLVGPAKLAGRDAYDWAEGALMADANGGTVPRTAKDIAAASIRDLEWALTLDNNSRRAHGYDPASEIGGFVACVAGTERQGTAIGEVWTFAIDHQGVTGPSEALGFADADRDTAWPFVAIPARPPYQDPEDDGLGQLPADVILERFQSSLTGFRTTPLSFVRDVTDQEMAGLTISMPGPFVRHGVGGSWTLIELRVDARPAQFVRDWGPMPAEHSGL